MSAAEVQIVAEVTRHVAAQTIWPHAVMVVTLVGVGIVALGTLVAYLLVEWLVSREKRKYPPLNRK